jgi:hypothetical protein
MKHALYTLLCKHAPYTMYTVLQGPYFIGKTLWSKGYDKLLPLLRSYRRYTGENFEMEAYGDGPDKQVMDLFN